MDVNLIVLVVVTVSVIFSIISTCFFLLVQSTVHKYTSSTTHSIACLVKLLNNNSFVVENATTIPAIKVASIAAVDNGQEDKKTKNDSKKTKPKLSNRVK